MYYSDSVQQSREYLRTALGFIGEHGIPADPLNYAVWYEYVAGKNIALNQAIEEILDQYGAITPEINAVLYSRYIADAKTIIVEAVQKELRHILTHLSTDMTEAEMSINRSGRVFHAYSDNLEETLDAEAIRSIAEKIADEINGLQLSSGHLQDRLKKASEKVEKLQVRVEKVRKEAETDCLTGLANRRSLERRLEDAVALAQATQTYLCLIMADIDHFKKVNDTYGHLVGDNVLRLAGKVIKSLIRGNDFAARYGGEEFVILLPETSAKGALVVAEKIRRYFETAKLTKKKSGEAIGTVTLSLGISHYKRGDSPKTLIERADRALYESKSGGRNRISLDNRRLLN